MKYMSSKNGRVFYNTKPRPKRKEPRWSYALLAGALISILIMILSASGCSSATIPPSPLKPVGKPSPETAREIYRDLQQAPRGPDAVLVPRPLMVRIFAHLDEWRAWALALEAAGAWRD